MQAFVGRFWCMRSNAVAYPRRTAEAREGPVIGDVVGQSPHLPLRHLGRCVGARRSSVTAWRSSVRSSASAGDPENTIGGLAHVTVEMIRDGTIVILLHLTYAAVIYSIGTALRFSSYRSLTAGCFPILRKFSISSHSDRRSSRIFI